MNIHEIIQLYKEGKSLTFIANKYNIYGVKIKKVLIDNNIAIRTRAEQNAITNQERAKKVNHNYFDKIDNCQKAWLLGFLTADSNIHASRNRIKIGLSSVDKDILEKIQQEIQLEKEILDYETNKGFKVSELSWSSANQKIKLAQYGIVPNKTYKELHLPNFKTDDFKFAYILGYFDGDGCFKNDGNTCRIEICSYNSTILQDFADFINKTLSIPKKVYKNPSRKNYYTITYSAEDATRILNKMYEIMNKNNYFYLQRKYQKYKDWQKQNNRI